MPYSFKAFLVLVLLAGQGFSAVGETFAIEGEPAPSSFKWRATTIPIAISASLLRQPQNLTPGSDVLGAIRRSLRTWEEAAGIEFKETFSDKQNVSPQGVAGDGVSLITIAPIAENVVLFAKNPDDTAAATRVFFDGRGRITEADIVLNPYQQFSTDGTFGTFDLQSTLTHEIGHFLGLAHSSMKGSTMHENFAKNGIFGIQAFTLRTLGELDRTAIRAKYGPPETDTGCCGSISAKILTPDGRLAAGLDVWVEDAKTGRVFAQAATNSDGVVVLGGLPAGAYSLYSQRKLRANKGVTPTQAIASVTVENGGTVALTKRLSSGPDDVDATFIGFNGQISDSVIPVNKGKTYTIYVGGKNLSAKSSSISFSSPHLTAAPSTLTTHDFGDGFSVISFELSLDAKTPIGEYSVFVHSAAGGRSVIVGGIAVRTFLNPFSNFVLEGS